MSQRYIPIYLSWLEDTEQLSDQEKGRLIDALVLFARGEEWQSRIKGNEKFVVKLLMGQIERAAVRSETNRANGSKGGRPASTKTENNPTKAKKSENNPSVNSGSHININSNSNINSNINSNGNSNGESKRKDSAEPSAGSAPEAGCGIAITLNTGERYEPTESKVEQWAQLYPAVDVRQQLRNMSGWCDANRAKRKTRGGVERFIAGWLAREQDRGARPKSGGEKPQNQALEYTQRSYTPEQLQGVYMDIMSDDNGGGG